MTDRAPCACHGLPMWSNGDRLVCQVRRAEQKKRVKVAAPVITARREREARKARRRSVLGPDSAVRDKRARVDAASRYSSASDLNLAARAVRASADPIDRGPGLPPLCACHHEPMLTTSAGGWRCGPGRRERDRELEQKRKTEDYAKWREKARRSERRRRAAKQGVRSEPYTRQEVYARDAGLCRYCGEGVGTDWHIAHLVALARGGEDTLDNVAVSCAACNIADGVGRLPVQLHLPTAA